MLLWGGVPAKVLKYRFDEKTIEKLMTLKWWEMQPKELDGVAFNDIHKAIKQIEEIRGVSQKAEKQKNISDLQAIIDERMDKTSNSAPSMTFEEISEIISSQLLEADIDIDAVEEILAANKNMNRDYDRDEYADQVTLNHKIAALIEIVLGDDEYIVQKVLSEQGHKRVKSLLGTKY